LDVPNRLGLVNHVGTIPAVANAPGLDALGIELAKKRGKLSRAQIVTTAGL